MGEEERVTPGEDVENGEARNQNISSADIYAKDSIYVGYSYHHPLNVTCKILNKMCLFIHLFIQYKFIKQSIKPSTENIEIRTVDHRSGNRAKRETS